MVVVCHRIVCGRHMVWETYACVDNTRIMMKTEGVLLLVVCGFVFAVQCLAQHQLCWVCWW